MTIFAHQLIEGQQHLMDNDKKLASVILRAGDCRYELRQDYFQSLVGSIISQQLSTKATSTIRQRLVDMTGQELNPQRIKAFKLEELRSVGLSRNKANYILKLAHQFDAESFNHLHDIENDDAIKFLTSFSGIGEWTAQMFLMFSLGKLDVLPINDVGVRNGIKIIYGLETLTDDELIEIANPWRPYRSIGAWYTWRALEL